MDAGLLTRDPKPKWWLTCRCYSCGQAERFYDVRPWPDIETLTGPFDLPFSEDETLTKVRLLLDAGQSIGAIKLYREKFGVGLHEVLVAIEVLRSDHIRGG